MLKRVVSIFAIAVLSPVAALAISSPVVINEVDYDQAGTVDGGEFIELMNISDKTVSLEDWKIELVDGATRPVPYT